MAKRQFHEAKLQGNHCQNGYGATKEKENHSQKYISNKDFQK